MRCLFSRRSSVVLVSSAGAGFATLFGFKFLRRVREEERQVTQAEAEAPAGTEPTPQTPLRIHAREAARETVATATRPLRGAAGHLPFRDRLAALPPLRRVPDVHVSRATLRQAPEAAWAAARRTPGEARAVAGRVRPPVGVGARVRTLPGQATGLLTRLRRRLNGHRGGHNGEA